MGREAFRIVGKVDNFLELWTFSTIQHNFYLECFPKMVYLTLLCIWSVIGPQRKGVKESK